MSVNMANAGYIIGMLSIIGGLGLTIYAVSAYFQYHGKFMDTTERTGCWEAVIHDPVPRLFEEVEKVKRLPLPVTKTKTVELNSRLNTVAYSSVVSHWRQASLVEDHIAWRPVEKAAPIIPTSITLSTATANNRRSPTIKPNLDKIKTKNGTSSTISLHITCDNLVMGVYQEQTRGVISKLERVRCIEGGSRSWDDVQVFEVMSGIPLAVECLNWVADGGLLAFLSNGKVSGIGWKCHRSEQSNWTRRYFNDLHWESAAVIKIHSRFNILGKRPQIPDHAIWIWTSEHNGRHAYCRVLV